MAAHSAKLVDANDSTKGLSVGADGAIPVRIVNPSDVGAVGVNFSTQEVQTEDVWIDGEPIYRKVLTFANGPNNGVVNVAHGITGLGTVIDVQGFMDNGTLQRNINNVEATAAIQCHYAVDNTNFILVSGVGGDYSGYSGFIILRYTKA